MVEHLTKEKFIEKVFDYTEEKEWNYKGDKPAMIDFWAGWCAPCKMVAPVIEELDKEYKGKVNFYKVNTEEQQELASVFGIRSIPSLLFIPVEGKPQMAAGALPKDSFEKAISDVLKVDECL
jgi:thioredoxin 1